MKLLFKFYCYHIITIFILSLFWKYEYNRGGNKWVLNWCMVWVDMIANRKSPRGKLFSFQSLIVLCLAANNIFTITSRFSCTHDHRIYILMLMAHFLVGQKGMCYSHQYSDAFTSDILSFLRMIIKFDYPNICFKENSHKKVHMIIKMMLILRYAKKKHSEMR